MANSECKKCHKPLASGNKCEACKQKERNKIKSIGTGALAIVGAVGLAALSSIFNKNEE